MKKRIIWLIGLVLLVAGTVGGCLMWMTWKALPVETIFSLIVAVLTLEATILIAVFINSLQSSASQREAMRQKSGAKQVLFNEIDVGLETIVRQPKAGSTGDISSHLSEILVAFLPSIQHDFSAEQLHHLIKLVDVLSNMSKLAASNEGMDAVEYIRSHLSLFVEERFISVMQSPYADCFAWIDDYHKVLVPVTRAVLEKLSGQTLPAPATNCLKDVAGNIILEILPDGHYRIYKDGQIVCDASLDDDLLESSIIVDGWAQTEWYVGEFKGGKRDGKGVSYSTLGHHKVFEGYWESGEPKQGIQFNTVLRKVRQKDDTYGYRDISPYWNEYSFLSSHVTDNVINSAGPEEEPSLEGFFVGDIRISQNSFEVEEDLLCPLERFMAENDPEALYQFRKNFDPSSEDYSGWINEDDEIDEDAEIDE